MISTISFPWFQRTRLRATPEAIQNRLQDIEERISERQRILCLPQRFSKSKQLTRREMEIEKSLFQGADRHSFLKALYYQGMQSSLALICSLLERMVCYQSIRCEELMKGLGKRQTVTTLDECEVS
jgi:hypothetical protein